MAINHIPFLGVVEDVTSKFNKIPNKDFINKGAFPIIDQGANIVAGYTNDKSIITDLGYPVIVFGDHTRIIKYINFPFAIGADGVKVLSVDTEIAYPLYIYYFLKFLKIPNAGYSRHYKFLKDKKIILPEDIDDQKRIALVISQCEALIQKRRESINLLDMLLTSTFLEMFGDIRAKKAKYKWEKLRPYISAQSGKSSKYVRSEDKTDFPIYGGNGINGWAVEPLFKVPIVIAGRVGQNCGVIHVAKQPCWVTDNAIVLTILDNTKLNTSYLAFALSNSPILEKVKKLDLPFINQPMILDLNLPMPPIDIQNKFALIEEKIETIKMQLQSSLIEIGNLYESVNQRAFNGELDLSKVDISNMEASKKKEPRAVKENLMEEQTEELIKSFEQALPNGEVPSNRETDIRNLSIRQFLKLPEQDVDTEGAEFSHMDKDFFYQFIFTKGFPDRTFTLPELEQYAGEYILRGTGFEFTYENWKTIIFRFLGAKQPILEQVLEEYKDGDKLTKAIKLKLTDEAFKV